MAFLVGSEDTFDAADASGPPNAFNEENFDTIKLATKMEAISPQMPRIQPPEKAKQLNLLNLKNDDFAT